MSDRFYTALDRQIYKIAPSTSAIIERFIADVLNIVTYNNASCVNGSAIYDQIVDLDY